MKKIFLLTMASLMTVFVMAVGRNDGSTKGNAIDFDWTAPMEHDGGTKWYRVDLAPLYEEESPALNLFLANKDVRNEVHTSLKATVAGQTDEKSFTIGPKQQKIWSANAAMLVRLKLTEIYLTLTSDGPVMLSARVFEAQDLDETCRDAKSFKWSGFTQSAGVPIWYKVILTEAKANTDQDVCVIVTNQGSSKLTLHTCQSLDCPSSGSTKRTIELEAGQTLRDTIPNSMIRSVAYDELYVSLENDQPIAVSAEFADRPPVAVLPADNGTNYTDKVVPDTALHQNDTTLLLAGVEYLYRFQVSALNALQKYEPEFTYLNEGLEDATIIRKMAFEVPAYTAQGTNLELAAGEENVEVLSKNTLIGLEAEYIYVKLQSDKDIKLISRFKHVREGKACKTNIQFNWESGHRQEAGTTQWYAIDVAEARDSLMDIIAHVVNLNEVGGKAATVHTSMAFSCPYIDLQEMSRKIAADGNVVSRKIAYSTYAMMSPVIYIGITTDQPIRFWADTVRTQTKEPDEACLTAVEFDWKSGVLQNADETVWYKIAMDSVKDLSALFPTVFVQNYNTTEEAVITAELSLECPDSIANQKRSLTIAANSSYSKQVSRNMFENISQDTVYLKVHTTQQIKLEIRLTEEAAGASCKSAIPFNWISGNSQDANANLWYAVELNEVIKGGYDIKLHIKNRDNEQCKGVAQLIYECPNESAPSVQDFKLAANAEKSILVQNSAFETLSDSVVYVNLQGTTGLRFWVEKLAPQPFDTINASDIAHMDTLYWDSLYTQTADTAWYIIPKSEIDRVRNLDEKVKPVAHLWNNGTVEATYKAEGAFAFPITKTMMSKSQKLNGGQHKSDTIPSGSFDQILKNDSIKMIIIRMTRPVSGSDFQFKAELVKAFSGNTRADALPIRMGELYTQAPNTEMWYKLNTKDLKKNKDLYNKALYVSGKNAGKGDAKVTASVYEGLLSNVDLLEEYGLSEYRERTIKKGQSKAHNIPAQAIYGVGDVELYILIRTTDSLVFETKFNGTYAHQDPDPNQQKAKLLVPNVEYTIPAGDQAQWYQVCIPYIRNNYKYYDINPDYLIKPDSVGELRKYICASYLTYELNGTANIEGTFTFQDTMDCAMPVRKRTINKSGGNHKGTQSLEVLLNKAIKKAGQTFDVSSFQPTFVDSLLRRYVTADSITAYVRIKTDKEMKVMLTMPQTTGDGCYNAMAFDWEHGNVNPKGKTTWFEVIADSTMIPATCDIRLHLDNWSAGESKSTANLQFTCEDIPTTVNKTIAANGSEFKDIDRDYLVKMGWPSKFYIEYTSDSTTHVWIELIKHKEREIKRDSTTLFVCLGADTLGHTITEDTWWEEKFTDKIDSVHALVYDSIMKYKVFVLRDPDQTLVDGWYNKLTIERKKVLDVTAADTWIKAQFAAAEAANDTLKKVTDITWKYTTNGTDWNDIPSTPLASEWINVKYIATVQCDGEWEDTLMHQPVDTTKEELTYCRDFSYVWHDTTLYAATTEPLPSWSMKKTNMADSIAYLSLKLTQLPAQKATVTEKKCNFYYWELKDTTIYNSGEYTDTLECAASNGGDSIVILNLTINNPQIDTLPLVHMYGYRLLMIDRNAIIATYKWELDTISDMNFVTWYKMVGAVQDPTVDQVLKGEDGSEWHNYYYTNALTGTPLVGSIYARIELPASGDDCGFIGTTVVIDCPAPAGAPALMPTLARPGQDIQVLNLDPEMETIIRVYSTEGLLMNNYSITGQETFTFKAAYAYGYYLVEVRNDSHKVTLRYIVK